MKRLPLLFLLGCCLAPQSPAQVPKPPGQKPNPPVDLKWDRMDLGPYQSGTFKVRGEFTAKGLAIRVGAGEQMGTVLFDTELLCWRAAWTGGFLRFPRARGGVEGQIEPAGEVVMATGYAPGWALGGGIGEDPRPRHQGHLPTETAKWRGLYLHEGRTVLSYTVGPVAVLELPEYQTRYGAPAFTRTLRVEKSAQPLTLLVWDASPELPRPDIHIRGAAPEVAKLRTDGARTVLEIAPHPTPLTFQIVLPKTPPTREAHDADRDRTLPDLAAMTKGGPTRWGAPLVTKGTLGTGEDAYVADEITIPEDNRYGSWFRPGGHDFLADGRVVLASLSGDVWLVSGLDEKLEHVRWQRFATGLFQPLGVRVVGEKIYVLGRDQITRLADLNGDGEADHYECFNNDCVVTENYHEFGLDLQTDPAGNFIYAKGSPWQPTVMSPHQGCLLRVSPDGSKLDVIATGLRAPNGVGMGPKGEITVSDNQGHWMPANRLNLIRPGGFYGMVPAAHRVMSFSSPEGEFSANPSSAADQAARNQNFWGSAQTPKPKEGHDRPLCWLPMPIDNSSGGEVWVPEGTRWGPLAGRMLQMTYGKCALFEVLMETVEGVPQAGLVRFPMKFPSGIMRGRFSPLDGQLYLTGLRVWQTDGSKDGCFSRVRYTGRPLTLPLAMRTTATGVELTFAQELDPPSAGDTENYSLEQWNYLWSGAYGSPDFSVRHPEKRGRDTLTIEKVTLSADRKTVALTVADWRPAMQAKLKYSFSTAAGQEIDQEIYSTIHRVPGQPAPVLP